MNITKNELPRSEIELTIELSPEEWTPHIQEATKRLSFEVTMDGFRPGKIPSSILSERLGEEKILERASRLAIGETYLESLRNEQLVALGPPKIKILERAPEKPFVYKATVALLPNIKIGDWRSLRFQKRSVNLTEKEVDEMLAKLQEMRAQGIPMDRPIAQNDKVEIDIELSLDGVPLEEDGSMRQTVVIGSHHTVLGFEENLLGMKKGESKEFPLHFPKNYFRLQLAGRRADCRVKVRNVFEIHPPLLDDAFAQSCGKFESLSALREQISKNIRLEKEEKEQERLELEILEKIIERSTFGEFPDLLLKGEIDKMIEELKVELERQNLSFENYLTHLRKSEEELRNHFRPRAERRIQTALVTRKVAELEGIEVSETDLEEELTKLRRIHGGDLEVLKRLEDSEMQTFILNTVRNRKTLQHLQTLLVE